MDVIPRPRNPEVNFQSAYISSLLQRSNQQILKIQEFINRLFYCHAQLFQSKCRNLLCNKLQNYKHAALKWLKMVTTTTCILQLKSTAVAKLVQQAYMHARKAAKAQVQHPLGMQKVHLRLAIRSRNRHSCQLVRHMHSRMALRTPH